MAAAPLTTQPFAAYGSGAAAVVEALGLGSTQVANVIAASSGGGVNSQGLNTPLVNEFGINVAPATPDKNALGRGTGLETGLVTPDPQATTLNQLLLEGVAIATAPPPSPLVTEEIALPVNPVLYASLLRGQAQATYDPAFCPVGRPLTYGMGHAANLELLNLGGGGSNPQTGFETPLAGTSATAFGTPRAASQSRTVTYLRANGDGTFGVVSETRQTVAPISLLANEALQTELTVEIAGEFGLQVIATGKPTGSGVAYTGNPVLTITQTTAGVPLQLLQITLQQLLGQNGLVLDVPGIATISLGAPPRQLGGGQNTAPQVAPDGTSASGAVDAVRLQLLDLPGLSVLDLALGHMEGAVTVPAGGLTCDIPVSKVASADPVTVGEEFTYTIRIPSDSALYEALYNCDLVNISAVDTVETVSGNPRIQLLSASNGGVISGNRVTWANLGTYTRGQEPITLTIQARIPPNSGAGVLRDTVNVSATLGNCRGGATGEDIVQGGAQLDGNAITGSVTLIGPNVTRGNLAATGGNAWPLVAGGGFLLAALGLVRLRRRAAEVPART
ncbi:MAG TPA: hypothetical protein VHF27_10300 [Acidimicrobiales bacterium]|nr:hypothetical protein [Acidimicrobiales bacterium]